MFAVTTVTVTFALSIACGQPATDESQPTTQKDLKPIAAPQQPAAKAEHVFRGKVEKVDAAAKALTVNGENVTGWMGAMTMVYTADNPDIFARVKTGDQITAKVFDGDFSTLHDVQVTTAASK